MTTPAHKKMTVAVVVEEVAALLLSVPQERLKELKTTEKKELVVQFLTDLFKLPIGYFPTGPSPYHPDKGNEDMVRFYGSPSNIFPVPLSFSYTAATNFFTSYDGIRIYFGQDNNDKLVLIFCACTNNSDNGTNASGTGKVTCFYGTKEYNDITSLTPLVSKYQKGKLNRYKTQTVYFSKASLKEFSDSHNFPTKPDKLQVHFGITAPDEIATPKQLKVIFSWVDNSGKTIISPINLPELGGANYLYDDNGQLYPPGGTDGGTVLNSTNSIFYS